MLPSALYIMWSMHLQSLKLLRQKLKEEKHLQEIQYLTFDLDLGSRSHKMLPCTLYIMWPIHLQSLKLLSLTVKEEIHLQENSIFDLWPWPWDQGHIKCCPVPSTSCGLFSYKVWSCYVKMFRRRCIYKKIQYLTFDIDLGVKITQNVAQYPLHHVTYSATKFEVAMSNSLGGDTFTRKYNIWPLTLTLESRSNEMLPSTLYIMWPIQLQSLKLLPLTV